MACENSKPGTPASEWDIQWTGDSQVQGFATSTSALPGGTVSLQDQGVESYAVDIYRLGYYGGDGARRQAPTWTVATPSRSRPAPPTPARSTTTAAPGRSPPSGRYPSTAVSGVYIAKLTMGTDASEIPFVVRGDAASDVVMKTSDATWQAYNTYGGARLLQRSRQPAPSTQARAFKISYNRPYATRDVSGGRDFLYSNEYPTLRFLERNGVDVSYTTDVDVSTGATDLTFGHRTFLSVGHDEYWTGAERAKVEAARDAGVNLMFLSGNEVYWHTRLEASIDGTATPNRTIVCYKDSWETAEDRPRRRARRRGVTRRSRPPPGRSRRTRSTGTHVHVELHRPAHHRVVRAGQVPPVARHVASPRCPRADPGARPPHGRLRVGRGRRQRAPPGRADAPVRDDRPDRPARPERRRGTQVAPGTTTHSLTLYRAASGALVFGAGTINWGWGLDQYHDGDNTNPADPRMQQATLNMLADMGAAPDDPHARSRRCPAASSDHAAPR